MEILTAILLSVFITVVAVWWVRMEVRDYQDHLSYQRDPE